MPDQRVFLKEHPAHPSVGIKDICVTVQRDADGLKLVYELNGEVAGLIIPDREAGIRRDGLWKYTCFELFLGDGSGPYVEFNFSPGGDWAAYRFSQYREHVQDLDCPAPVIETRQTNDLMTLSVNVPACLTTHIKRSPQIGLSAVIESKHGTKSYWALDHASEAPDFHRSETFTLNLD